MICEACRQKVSAYVEGDLPEKDRQEVREHTKKCKQCRRELHIYKRMISLTANIQRHTPGTDVVLKISESIHRATRPQRRTEFGPVLDMAELADFLRVDQETIGEYLDEIPCFELGGKLLFRRKSIEDWIDKRETSFFLQMNRSELANRIAPLNLRLGDVRWRI